MANRRQREDRRRRRTAHMRGEDRRPEPIEPEDFEGGRGNTPRPLTRKQKAWSLISDVGLWMQLVGVLIWIILMLFHHGHLGAWIGAGVAELGYVLIWTAILVMDRKMLRKDAVLYIVMAVALLCPSLGLTVGVLVTWWVGVIAGVGMLIWCFLINLVAPRRTRAL